MDRLNAGNRLPDGGRSIVEYPIYPDFKAPLTTSIIPIAGVDGVSFTRALVGSVFDHEGLLQYCKSGEARFQGARRVENLMNNSQTLDNGAFWIKNATTLDPVKVPYTDGSLIGYTLIPTATTIQHYIVNAGTFIAGNTYIWSASIKASGVNFAQFLIAGEVSVNYQNFDLINGVTTGTADVGSMVDEGNGWWRCSMKLTSIANLTVSCYILVPSSMSDTRFPSTLGDGVNGISITRVQLEDVTGQSIQTVGDYVSTNVLNSAPYHGANVDGVKYFDTDLNGSKIPDTTLKGFLCEGARTNLFLRSNELSNATWNKIGGSSIVVNQAIAPDGRMTMSKFLIGASGQFTSLNQTVTVATANYTISVYARAGEVGIIQMLTTATMSATGYVNFDLTDGTVGSSSDFVGSIYPVTGKPGLYLCTATGALTSAGGLIHIAVVPSKTSPRAEVMTGPATDGLYLWQPQLELGTTASSRIITEGVIVNRPVDNLSMGVKNAITNNGACSIVVHMDDDVVLDRRAISFSGSNNNRLQLQARRTVNEHVNLYFGDGGAIRSLSSGTEFSRNNIVFAWTNLDNVALYMQGVKYLGAYVPDLIFTTVDIGGGAVGLPIFGCIKNVQIWKSRPTDAELTLLSNNP